MCDLRAYLGFQPSTGAISHRISRQYQSKGLLTDQRRPLHKPNWQLTGNDLIYEQLYSEEVAKRIEWLERQIQRIDMFADSVHLMNQQAQMATAEVRTLKK